MKFRDQRQLARTSYLSFVFLTALAVNFFDLFRPNAFAAPIVRTVAFGNQPAPGTPSGVIFSGLGIPVINSSGQVSFRASLSGNDVTSSINDRGIWSDSSGSLGLVIRNGSHAPGTPDGVNFAGLSVIPVLNATGTTAFHSTLTGPGVVVGSNNIGFWSGTSSNVDLIFRAGDQVPGTSGDVKFGSSLTEPEVLNSTGQTAFRSSLNGVGVEALNNSSIWSGVPGNLTLVARTGSHAPGTSSGVNFRQELTLTPTINDSGQLAFSAGLTDSVEDGTTGFWVGVPGNLRMVARATMQAPGMASGIKFGSVSISAPALNNAGQTAFGNLLSNGKTAVYSEGNGVLHLVALEGTPAVGTPAGVNFSNFSKKVLNAAGQIAFGGGLTGAGVTSSNSECIWSEGTGTLKLVAREGMNAPGTPDGVTFGGIASSPFSSPSINALGQTVFTATLTGTGVDSTNDKGIWATDLNGVLKLIIRVGDPLEVAPGDIRTISQFGFVGDTYSTGNQDGMPTGFNDSGQLAFNAAFTDGTSGVFVSNVVAALEPSSILLVLSGVFSICLRRVRPA